MVAKVACGHFTVPIAKETGHGVRRVYGEWLLEYCTMLSIGTRIMLDFTTPVPFNDFDIVKVCWWEL